MSDSKKYIAKIDTPFCDKGDIFSHIAPSAWAVIGTGKWFPERDGKKHPSNFPDIFQEYEEPKKEIFNIEKWFIILKKKIDKTIFDEPIPYSAKVRICETFATLIDSYGYNPSFIWDDIK